MTRGTLSCLKVQKMFFPKIISVRRILYFLNGINWKIICVIGLFASGFLIVYYVWQVNCLIKNSYLIDNFQEQINKLSDEKKEIEISVAKNSFLGQVQQRIRELNFQKTTSVKYIQVLDNSFAAVSK